METLFKQIQVRDVDQAKLETIVDDLVITGDSFDCSS